MAEKISELARSKRKVADIRRGRGGREGVSRSTESCRAGETAAAWGPLKFAGVDMGFQAVLYSGMFFVVANDFSHLRACSELRKRRIFIELYAKILL